MKFQVRYNPHSDLANLAQYQLDCIEKKSSSGHSNGIGMDMQACLISHAFLAEALINMAGFGLLRESFKEKESYIGYLKDLLWNHAAIGLEFNSGENPLTPGNPKNAWLVNFGDYSSNEISIVIAIAD
ncbi:hypothetical protein ACE34R_002787 [Vibrio cholerae]